LSLLPILTLSCKGNEGVTFSPSKGSKNINPDTHLCITFPGTPTVGTSGMIRIYDAATGKVADSLDMSLPAGLTESRTYPPECDYTKVPYDYSREEVATNKNTLPGTPSGTAEATPRDMQLTIIGGFTDGFRFHPVLVRGNTAVIYPHNNMLEYGKSYYVTIDEGVISYEDFKGIRGKEWKFTTKASAPSPGQRHLRVACDGSGDFNTVQGALDAVPDFCSDTTYIDIEEGDYEEIVYARNKRNVVISGAGKDKTHVHYANNEVFNPHPVLVKTNEWRGTFPSRRAAFALDNCSDIVLRDISIATDLKGQAEGLLLNGERIALYNVKISGSGDALQANGTIYMEQCEVEGDADTILGRGSLFAYKSSFINHGGPLSWVRNVKPDHGDVFVECHFEGKGDRPADFGRTGNNHGRSYPDAEFVVINCTTRNFNPSGWSEIGCKSATMLEFGTRDADSGAPVNLKERHPYARVLDENKDAALITSYSSPEFVLKGWNPRKK